MNLFFKGKNDSSAKNKSNIGENVCLSLTRFYHNQTKPRTLTADNFFSSFDLVTKLYDVNFRYCGTLRKNKPQIPASFQPNKEKPTFSSLFGFKDEKTLVSYVPKPKKAVILISSEHHTTSISRIDFKPDIILFYNKNKAAVDAFDQKIESILADERPIGGHSLFLCIVLMLLL